MYVKHFRNQGEEFSKIGKPIIPVLEYGVFLDMSKNLVITSLNAEH